MKTELLVELSHTGLIETYHIFKVITPTNPRTTPQKDVDLKIRKRKNRKQYLIWNLSSIVTMFEGKQQQKHIHPTN